MHDINTMGIYSNVAISSTSFIQFHVSKLEGTNSHSSTELLSDLKDDINVDKSQVGSFFTSSSNDSLSSSFNSISYKACRQS